MSLVRGLTLAALLALPVGAGEVTVFAAASLKTALDRIAADWQAATGHGVVLSYGGSSAMAKQIEAGAPADVFVSAAESWMDYLQERALIRPETRRDLLGNSLVLVASTPRGVVVDLKSGEAILAVLGDGKLSMALVDAVPAGQYGKEALVSLGVWDQVRDQVVQSENVTQALRLVDLGEAEFGIGYGSDLGTGLELAGTFPETSHSPITYPAALTVEAAPEAAAFLDYLEGPEAEAVFLALGFRPLP